MGGIAHRFIRNPDGHPNQIKIRSKITIRKKITSTMKIKIKTAMVAHRIQSYSYSYSCS